MKPTFAINALAIESTPELLPEGRGGSIAVVDELQQWISVVLTLEYRSTGTIESNV